MNEINDPLVRTAPLARFVRGDMEQFFETDLAQEALTKLRRASTSGRPLGGAEWLKALNIGTG